MRMKRLILGLFLSLFILGPLYAQEEEEVPEEDVEQEAPAEDAEAEAPAEGGGGGGTSDLMFGAGSLYTFMIGATDETNAADSQAFFPRGTVLFGFDGFSLGGELLLKTFTVTATGVISSSSIAAAELVFEGQTYSGIVEFGDEIGFYGGYGINQFSISDKEDGSISASAASSGITFSQDIEAKAGTQIILGVDWSLGDALSVNGDFRLMMVPADLVTKITQSGASSATETTTGIDFNFMILSLGASYFF